MHLFFFTSITLYSSLDGIDWDYLKKTLVWIIPPTLVGVVGLLNLPAKVIVIFIYCVTIFYALNWILDKKISSNKSWLDKIFFILGGYISGTSLTGAPLIVAVYMRFVDKSMLRNTMFVLWIILVGIKMTAFVVVGVSIDWQFSLYLIPIAAIGHVFGIYTHKKLIENDQLFKRWIGGALLCISSFGMFKVLA